MYIYIYMYISSSHVFIIGIITTIVMIINTIPAQLRYVVALGRMGFDSLRSLNWLEQFFVKCNRPFLC